MASSPRDDNRVSAIMLTSSVDGITPISVYINPTTKAVKIENGISGSSLPFVNAERDDDRIPTLWATSSGDGVTIIPVYGNPTTNALLTQST